MQHIVAQRFSAATSLGKQIVVFSASSESELDTAFASMVQQRIGTRRLKRKGSEAPRSDLTINLKTAKALGLNVPFGLLNAADEVIE